MKVLIACEESQVVCKAFRELGHEAYSCDLQECSGGHPEWHIMGNVVWELAQDWDLIIMHPPCTYTALCGNRWYHDSPKRIEGAEFCKNLWEYATDLCYRVALEQPKTIMQSYIGPKSQVVHPWQFGHPETKETWLWLENLPPLQETNNVYDYMMTLPKNKRHKVWYASPGNDRGKNRSKTYLGIARAMAAQWGSCGVHNQSLEANWEPAPFQADVES